MFIFNFLELFGNLAKLQISSLETYVSVFLPVRHEVGLNKGQNHFGVGISPVEHPLQTYITDVQTDGFQAQGDNSCIFPSF